MFSKVFSNPLSSLIAKGLLIVAFIFFYPHYLDWLFFHEQDKKTSQYFEMIGQEIKAEAQMRKSLEPDTTYWRNDTLIIVAKPVVVYVPNIPAPAEKTIKDTIVIKKVIKDTVLETGIDSFLKGARDIRVYRKTEPRRTFWRGDTIYRVFSSIEAANNASAFYVPPKKTAWYREPDSTYCIKDTLVSIYRDKKGNVERIRKSKF